MDNLKSFEQYSDKDIIQKILAGERSLFEILIRRINSFLHKTGMSYGFSHEDTQDLMQETFINAYMNLSKFEGRSSFKTWAMKIMINNCFQKINKHSFQKETTSAKSINEKSTPMYSVQHPDPHKSAVNRKLAYVVENSLINIPLEYRMVFSLRQISGLNVSETAEVLNISESNVKVRLNRAKSMLRKEIEKVYTPEEIFEFNLIYCDAMVKRVFENINKLQP